MGVKTPPETLVITITLVLLKAVGPVPKNTSSVFKIVFDTAVPCVEVNSLMLVPEPSTTYLKNSFWSFITGSPTANPSIPVGVPAEEVPLGSIVPVTLIP